MVTDAGSSKLTISMTTVDEYVTEHAVPAPELRALSEVRQLVAHGDIASAIDVISAKLPQVLQDQRLIFRLRKQQFVELIRTCQPGGLTELAGALGCARSQLATSALDAYPEAYTEFKHALQLLVYANNQEVDSNTWPPDCRALIGQAARIELAEMVYQTAMQILGLKESRLVQLLVHLLRLRREHPHLRPAPDQRQQPPNSSSQQPPSSSQQQPDAQDPPRQQPQPDSDWGPPLATLQRTDGWSPRGSGGGQGSGTARGSEGGHSNGAGTTNGAQQGNGAGQEVFVEQSNGAGQDNGTDQGLGAGQGVAGSSPRRSRSGKRSSRSSDPGSKEHNHLNHQQGGHEAVSELCERLLRPGCDAAPLPVDVHGPVVASFNESDIQTLIRCAGSQRRDAIAALRACNNRLLAAFQMEIGRLQINRPLLDELVQEYASARGLHDLDHVMHDEDHVTHEEAHVMHVEEEAVAAIGDVHLDERGRLDEPWTPGGRARRLQEVRMPGHTERRLSLQRSASQSPPAKQPCCRLDEPARGGSSLDLPSHGVHVGMASRSSQLPQLPQLPAIAKAGGPLALHAAVAELAPGFWESQPALLFDLWACEFSRRVGAGELVEALTLARAHLTPLAMAHPALQPQLKIVMGLLIPTAPSVPKDLSPPESSSKVRNSKETAKGGSQDASKVGNLATLDEVVASVTGLLSNTQLAGGSDTRLIHLLKELLAVHKAWLRAERCTDPFQADLGITSLRLAQPPRLEGSANGAGPGPMDVSNGAAPAAEPSLPAGLTRAHLENLPPLPPPPPLHGFHHMIPLMGHMGMQGALYAEDEDVEDEDEDEEGAGPGGYAGQGAGEADVARLQEILNLSRAQAVALLGEYGDVESAINGAFG